MPRDALTGGADGGRCAAGGPSAAPDYVAYHDQEWGRPVLDDDCSSSASASRSFRLASRGSRSCASAMLSGRPSPASTSPAVAAFGDRRRGAPARRRRHRAQPAQDRGGGRERAPLPGRDRRSRLAGGVHLVVPPRTGDAARVDGRLRRRPLPSPPRSPAAQTARLSLRGSDDRSTPTCRPRGMVNDHVEGCCVRDEVEREQIEAAARFA